MLACPVAQRSPALSTARAKAPLSSAAVARAVLIDMFNNIKKK
jgi:hypothetical protein